MSDEGVTGASEATRNTKRRYPRQRVQASPVRITNTTTGETRTETAYTSAELRAVLRNDPEGPPRAERWWW